MDNEKINVKEEAPQETNAISPFAGKSYDRLIIKYLREQRMIAYRGFVNYATSHRANVRRGKGKAIYTLNKKSTNKFLAV